MPNLTFANFELTNFPISNRLKQLGLLQTRSILYYKTDEFLPVSYQEANFETDTASFSTSQLGYLIPDTVSKNDKEFTIVINKNKGSIMFNGTEVQSSEGTTESEVRAKILIVLLESGLITKEEVNAKMMDFGYNFVVPF